MPAARRCGVACVLAAFASQAHAAPAQPAPAEIRVAPGPSGFFGAWLLLGPYRAASFGVRGPQPDDLASDPQTLAESTLSPRLGDSPQSTEKEPPAWVMASSGEGPVDVIAALKNPAAQKGSTTVKDNDLIAYAAGTLHLDTPGKLLLLIGSDDGVRVSVDGKVVLGREEARPERDDDDLIPLDLTAGDHPIMLKLHQRDGAWSFHVRVVDELLAPPLGAYLSLPGATPADAQTLAAKMSWVSLDRGTRGDGYHPALTVRFPEGAPLSVPLSVKATLADASSNVYFDINAGEVSARSPEMVVALPQILGADLQSVEDKSVSYAVKVAGRDLVLKFFPKKSQRETLAKADAALGALTGQESWLSPDSWESVQYARNRLQAALSRGDSDDLALMQESRELSQLTDSLQKQVDPYASRTGAMRMAYRSPADGELQEYSLYVPGDYKVGAKKKYPLIVVLHGLNGRPMAVLRKFLGTGETGREADWDERRMGGLPEFNDAFVVAPSGHGNTMYRDLGEDDVMRATDRVMARLPIDATRVTIGGPSMGGIGAAAVPFRFPDRFAAAEPLCGYHSYFVRRDFMGRAMRPWERTIAEERSNVEWAFNGANIPLYVVHGTMDWPETNSGVLIDKYEQLKYPIEHEHPNLGHNVWSTTWENLKGAKWLLGHRRDPHPSRVRFRTIRLRDNKSDWVHVDELYAPDQWGEVDAKVTNRTRIDATTSGVAQISLDRDTKLIDAAGATKVVIDGTSLSVPASDALVFHRDASGWQSGAAVHAGPFKHGEVTGPIRDAFHANLMFVWGKDDPAQARANEEVAKAFAAIRFGVTVRYPIMSDEEFAARGESLANDHALFLVGNAKSNRLVRALEPELPIKIEGDTVVMGGVRYQGNQLGAAFVRPNPKRTDRYLVVVEGTTALGTWRSLSLPDLLPDFVVYDEKIEPSRGQMLLSNGAVLAGGFFKNDWSLPQVVNDPLANSVRPAAKTKRDATPYLP